MSLTQSNPSISHTFGNVACLAISYIQSFFPENYFTKTHISTKMAHRQLDVFRAKPGFWKNKKPMLVLRPRIGFDDSSRWFYGSAMTNRMTHGSSPMEFGDIHTFLRDPERKIDVSFLWNRYKIIYDIAIITDTYNKQTNITNDLINRLAIDGPPPRIPTTLEAYIPRAIINEIAEYLNIEKTDTAKLLDYMNTYAVTPVTYKLQNSSGHDEFFMMYPTKVETICSDLTPEDGEMRGMIADTYTISLSMSMEFYGIGVWYSFIANGLDEFRVTPIDDESYDPNRIIPIMSVPLGYNLRLEHGWKILASPFYIPDTPENGVDTTSMESVMGQQSIQSLINHSKAMSVPLDPFLKFRCFKGGKELPRGVHGFDIDLNNQCIYTYNPDETATYRLFVLVNTLAINNMAAEITNLNKEI